MEEFVEKIVNCPCLDEGPKFPRPYSFPFNASQQIEKNKSQFQSNFIKTSKYTMITFLPKALILQFKRLANVYFLIAAILMSIPIISPINAFSAWGPLIIVIAISMIRQGYEDYQRYKSDEQLNYQEETVVFRGAQKLVIKWADVIVGDICYVETDELFPADLLLLSTDNQSGVAYIETASLDGEKNLKPRNAFEETAKLKEERQILLLRGQYDGDVPNKQLHQFEATVSISGPFTSVLGFSGDKQLLYRGTRLKNTKYIYGLVAYTGKNTKILLNSESQSIKMSQIQKKVNYILGIILIIQGVLCLICGVSYGFFRRNFEQTDSYIQWPDFTVSQDWLLIFLTYFVLLNTMIPISLIVSMEMVKLFQKYFIEKDRLMFSQYRQKGVEVHSASLNEQLGQIEYIFTDKTGTLTMNIMQFKIAVIGSDMYGDLGLILDKKGGRPECKGFRDDNLRKLLQNGSGDNSLARPIVVMNREQTDKVCFNRKSELARQYFLILGLAHEVVSQTKKNGYTCYQGPSPDQIALVEGASCMNYTFLSSNQFETCIQVNENKKKQKYKLLEVFPFTSDRKRMSVIIRDSDGRIKMFMKGADSIVKERVSADSKLQLDQELHSFSIVGLRTLLVAMRIISEAQYDGYLKECRNLPLQNKEAARGELISKLETDLYLVGATAVLDRLQEDVAETIRDFIRANIKVWMLTGDKLETAENIAKSCKLIQPEFEILKIVLPEDLPRIQVNELEEVRYLKEKQIIKATRQELQKIVNTSHRLEDQEGSTLTYVLQNQSNKELLASLAASCEAVVCCRLLPIQKAEVITVVRQKLNKITLAIGDGANDVPMIKTAHIGIGLYGQEGDYALPQFRMLWRLLFVHGRWNYIRISEMILYFFYKNMLFTLPQFIAAFYNGFSGQTIFDDIYITLYNLLFTSIPLVIRAVLQQDVNYVYKRQDVDIYEEPPLTGKSLLVQQGYLPDRFGINKYFYRLFPKIYFIGQQNCIFNYTNFFLWIVEGAFEAILISVFAFEIIGDASLRSTGINSDYWLVGLTIYTSVIMVVTFKLATHTRFWSICLILSIVFLSLGLYVVYMWISNYAFSTSFQGTPIIGWTTAEAYFFVIFATCLVLCFDGVIVFVDFRRGSYASKMRQVIHEEKINNRYFYDDLSLYITQGLTEQGK